MALSREEVLDAIADMSVMDVVQLVEAMEEKFGVSAATAVAAAPAPSPNDPIGLRSTVAAVDPSALVAQPHRWRPRRPSWF